MMQMHTLYNRVRGGVAAIGFALLVLSAEPLCALTVWGGGPIDSDVTDDDILITGTNTIGSGMPHPSSISVNAVTRNITITVSTGAVIEGQGITDGTAKLCLNASAFSITVNVPTGLSLTFEADSTTLTPAQPFLVLLTGSPAGSPANIIFNLDGNSQVVLTDVSANPATQVGTRMFLVMAPGGVNSFMTVQRNMAGADPNNIAYFVVQNGSFLSYLSNQPVSSGSMTDSGIITFNAANNIANPAGLLALAIGDRSGVIVSGHLYTTDTACAITNNDINMAVPAGLQASFRTLQNGSPTLFSGTVIVNQNQTLNSALPLPATNSLLINPFCIDQIFAGTPSFTPYTGLLYGFTVQANGTMDINPGTYVIYDVAATNQSPLPFTALSCNRLLSQFVKQRNPAALTFDDNTDTNATPPQLNIFGESALYLLGTVNCLGCGWTLPLSATGQSTVCDERDNEVGGAGLIVMDVEGRLNVNSEATNITSAAAINVLSLVIQTTGGSVLDSGTSTNFPLRTYATWPDGSYQRYPRSCILVRGTMTLNNMYLKHNDLSHNVDVQFLPGNFLLQNPEPTYIGGEPNVNIPSNTCLTPPTGCFLQGSFAAASACPGCPSSDSCPGCPVPLSVCPGGANTIAFVNSIILAQSNIASSGLTWSVPDVPTNTFPSGNTSTLTLFSNGNCFSALNGTQKTGITFALGSLIGSTAADGSTVLDPNSYINIQQTLTAGSNATQTLQIAGDYNNGKFLPGLLGAPTLTGQFNNHSIINLFGSSIQLGTDQTVNSSPFPLITNPTLNVNTPYVNFISQGGALQNPSNTGSSGLGGIYVDSKGTLSVTPGLLIGFDSVTIAQSGTNSAPSNVLLPIPQTFYGSGAGIQQWNLNLATSNIVVPLNTTYSEYTLDWVRTLKDFGNSDCSVQHYIPYQPPAPTIPAATVPMVSANFINLPTVNGTVDGQFQMLNSRIGDVAQLIVDGGLVRELVFINDNTAGIGPIGMVTVLNDGIVGLGSAERSYDSIYAQMVLGINGVTLIANGNGQVMLNQDVIINNYCHILTGPSFGQSGLQQMLITSEVPREIRVKNGGVLDLSQFVGQNQQLAIGGQVTLVFEPGSQLILGGGLLFFIGNSLMTFEPFVDFDFPTQTTVAGTNPYRVRISSFYAGVGPSLVSFLTFKEGSRCFIPRGALVGVESLSAQVSSTNQSWLLTDDARLEIGNSSEYGGGLQIGNTTELGVSVSWTLILNGLNATFEIEGQGFLGMGVGIINKPNDIPSNWEIGQLFDSSMTMQLTQGTWSYRTLYDSNNVNAGLVAINQASSVEFIASRVDSQILGGGNVILVNSGSTANIAPVVTTALSYGSGTGAYQGNILASSLTLLNASKSRLLGDPMDVIGALRVYNFITMDEYTAQVPGKTAVIMPFSLGSQGLGFVWNNLIWRQTAGSFWSGGARVGAGSALAIGAAGMALDVSMPSAPSAQLTVVNV